MEKIKNEELRKLNEVEHRLNELHFIHYDTPPSTQHIYNYRAIGRNKLTKYMNPKAKKFKSELIKTIKAQLPDNWKPLNKDMRLNAFIELTFPTQHKHDVDNYSKLILDSMNKLVYDDDSQILLCSVNKKYEKGEPRVRITICEKWRNQE
jgi:Holliday junction resolvase RusA-like endonuclease